MTTKKIEEFKFDGRKLKPFLTMPVKDFAKKLGISRVYLSSILSGKKTPSTDLATTMCVTLGAKINDIAIRK